MIPLDPCFNEAVVAIANRLFPAGFDVSHEAPATYEELKALLDARQRLVVYAGGSDHTIYGDPAINYAFRAWHDWTHWTGEHDLTLEGEIAVCQHQQRHLLALYGDTAQSRRWREIVHAEIIGQGTYYRYHKRFPDDQRGFVEGFLKDPERALVWPLW
jgi:hypothetical protein